MLFRNIYIEESVKDHPRVESLLERFSDANRIECENYGEVFNRSAQNFRLQKQSPSLILAKKFKNYVLPAPQGYGIGSTNNFYFSHMLNCVYDCRYCFLQGMYQSANYVLFVNYEDYFSAIEEEVDKDPTVEKHFFSGYDCDSLALEPVTGFAQAGMQFFATKPNALLELRTKSTQIRGLLEREPLDNVVVAFSLSPENIARGLEHKAPTLARRLEAIKKLAQMGWKIGLRFDPVIFHRDFETHYRAFFQQVFGAFDLSSLHSVSLGVFRLPTGFFRKAQRLYPEEVLFASPMQDHSGMMAYRDDIEQAMMAFCEKEILSYIDRKLYYPCSYE